MKDAISRRLEDDWQAELDHPVKCPVLDLIAVDDAVLAEYELRPGGGEPATFRQAIVRVAGTQIQSVADHGDTTARTTSEGYTPSVTPATAPGSPTSQEPANPAAVAAIEDFFQLHIDFGIDGVLQAWQKHAHPDVVLWHSAEGVRGRGIAQALDFYTRQHEKYPYGGFDSTMLHLATRDDYAAGEITYTLDRPDSDGVILLPASFAVQFDGDGRFVSWRDYSRFWIPETPGT